MVIVDIDVVIKNFYFIIVFISVNPHIRFGISKLGHYFLDFIPKEEIDRYLHRINFYSTNYKVVIKKQKLEK